MESALGSAVDNRPLVDSVCLVVRSAVISPAEKKNVVISIGEQGQGREDVQRLPIGKRIANETGDERNINDLRGG